MKSENLSYRISAATTITPVYFRSCRTRGLTVFKTHPGEKRTHKNLPKRKLDIAQDVFES